MDVIEPVQDVIDSVFTSRVQRTRPIPHDPPHTITFRKLAPRHLEAAKKESQRKAIKDVREVGPAFMKELEALTTVEEKKLADAAKADPMMLFDEVVLLQKGLLSWTYDAKLEEEVFEDLDGETLDFIAREILTLSLPKLFVTAEASEAEQKNG